MSLLAQFLLRLAFGLAVGMAITSSKNVSSGFFRNHLYVTLGLATLAALSLAKHSQLAMWMSVAAAVISYAGSVAWLYHAERVGQGALYSVAVFALLSAVFTAGSYTPSLPMLGIISSGLLLGLTTTAMLLGHWYLNSPGMELAPLRRLIAAAGCAVLLQAAVSSVSLIAMWQAAVAVPVHWVLLRWSFGIIGVAVTLWMAWQTLKIPNTQSATGILYVSVIGAFIGELAASLLSAESAFPL